MTRFSSYIISAFYIIAAHIGAYISDGEEVVSRTTRAKMQRES